MLRAAVFVLVLTTAAAVAAQTLEEARAGLHSANPGLRGQAAMALAGMGKAARPAVPELARAMEDRHLNVRYWAAKALAAIGAEAKAAVPQLTATLSVFPGGTPPLEGPTRYYADARSVAADALGAIGPGARDAVPALRKALQDPDASVREAAAAALQKIEPKK